MKKTGLDKGLICDCGVVALIMATGILFFGMFFLNIDVANCNYVALIGAYSGLTALIWMCLLCRNC